MAEMEFVLDFSYLFLVLVWDFWFYFGALVVYWMVNKVFLARNPSGFQGFQGVSLHGVSLY